MVWTVQVCAVLINACSQLCAVCCAQGTAQAGVTRAQDDPPSGRTNKQTAGLAAWAVSWQQRTRMGRCLRMHTAAAAAPAQMAGFVLNITLSLLVCCCSNWLYMGIVVDFLICLRLTRYMRIHVGLKAFYQVSQPHTVLRSLASLGTWGFLAGQCGYRGSQASCCCVKSPAWRNCARLSLSCALAYNSVSVCLCPLLAVLTGVHHRSKGIPGFCSLPFLHPGAAGQCRVCILPTDRRQLPVSTLPRWPEPYDTPHLWCAMAVLLCLTVSIARHTGVHACMHTDDPFAQQYQAWVSFKAHTLRYHVQHTKLTAQVWCLVALLLQASCLMKSSSPKPWVLAQPPTLSQASSGWQSCCW